MAPLPLGRIQLLRYDYYFIIYWITQFPCQHWQIYLIASLQDATNNTLNQHLSAGSASRGSPCIMAMTILLAELFFPAYGSRVVTCQSDRWLGLALHLYLGRVQLRRRHCEGQQWFFISYFIFDFVKISNIPLISYHILNVSLWYTVLLWRCCQTTVVVYLS